MEIYENESLKIIQDKNNKTIYKIIFNYNNPILIRSLIKTKLLKGATITDDYLMVRFKALSVESFQKFNENYNMERGFPNLGINVAAKMVADLTRQLEYLISEETVTILGYNIEDIIVIDGDKFAFLGSDLVLEIGQELVTISTPFKVTDFFVSPEMLKIHVLPSYIHYKTSYFSLGCLLLYALTGNDDFYKEYVIDGNCRKIKECLNQLHFKNTKLYWLLSRCLVEEPQERNILFI
jgi:hypothetical protein